MNEPGSEDPDSIAVPVFADIFIELTNTVSDVKIQITILILRRGALSRIDSNLGCHLAHTHNGLSCQCVSVVPAGGAIFGEAVRRHKPAPCNQLYFYFLYFVFCTLVYLLGERLFALHSVFVCWFSCIVYSFDLLCI